MTASQTYSKCGVPPRMTTPSATTASCRSASAWATTGSSTAPGARTTVGSATPLASAAATARVEQRVGDLARASVVATMPRRQPGGVDRLDARALRAAHGLLVDAHGTVRPASPGRLGLGLDDVEQVAHPVALGAQVAQVLRR